MNESIKIKCPWCNAVLGVKYHPNLTEKVIPCPVCKQRSEFKNFQLLTPLPNIAPPLVHDMEGTQYQSGTVGFSPSLGSLTVNLTGQKFELQPGANIIGRKSTDSKANFQIDMADKRRVSREHIVVDMDCSMPYTKFIVRLNKPKCNLVKVNGQPLVFGDQIVLTDKSQIELPDSLILTFNMNKDPNGTVLD